MPYYGGWGAMRKPRDKGDPGARVLPVEEVIDLLVDENGIAVKPITESLGDADATDGCTNEVRIWNDPQSGIRVMLVKVEGGGHVVPGGRQYLPQMFTGPVCNDFDHAEVMWRFFRQSKGR